MMFSRLTRNPWGLLATVSFLIFVQNAGANSLIRPGVVDRGYVNNGVNKNAAVDEYRVRFMQGKRALSVVVRGFDIDTADEVRVFVDDVPLGYLNVSRNRKFRTSVLDIPLAGVGQTKTLRFKPKNSRWNWGVAQISLVEQFHPAINLYPGRINNGRYGYRYGKRQSLRGVRFKFSGAGVEQILRVRGYDIDKPDDVSVLVNGHKLGNLRVSGNRKHRISKFSIPLALQTDRNVIEFVSHKGANQWGINKVTLTPASGADQNPNALANGNSPELVPSDAIYALPGDDLPAIARNAAENALIIIRAGTHRSRRIVPRHGQTFRCEQGAIISGAKRLTGTWQNDSGLWYLSGVATPSTWISGEMKPGRGINRYREDLFIDHRLYLRVDAKNKVTAEPQTYFGKEIYAGTFYQQGDRIYVAADPRNKLVEMSREVYGIRGPHPDHYGEENWNSENQGLARAANNVTIENCIFEKYASHAQLGAIEAAFTKNWKLVNVTARYNHGGGLRTGENTQVIGGSFSHNGHIGIHGSTGPCTDQGYQAFGGNLMLDGVEIAYNNWAGYYVPWEAGGIKVLGFETFSIKNSHVHHNFGKGIWTDTEVYDITIEHNDVHHNSSIGINLESSYGAKRNGSGKGKVRYNKIWSNAVRADDSLDWIWYWGAALLVQNSRDFEIAYNNVEVDRGQGIAVVNQGFGDRLCDRKFRPAVNNRVYRNETIFTGRQTPESDPNAWFHQKTGIESDSQARNGTIYNDCELGFTAIDAAAPGANNRFVENDYRFQNSGGRHWRFANDIFRWNDIPAAWEQGSTFNGASKP